LQDYKSNDDQKNIHIHHLETKHLQKNKPFIRLSKHRTKGLKTPLQAQFSGGVTSTLSKYDLKSYAF